MAAPLKHVLGIEVTWRNRKCVELLSIELRKLFVMASGENLRSIDRICPAQEDHMVCCGRFTIDKYPTITNN